MSVYQRLANELGVREGQVQTAVELLDGLRVKVPDVDIPRKRISLTLRLDDEAASAPTGGERRRGRGDAGGQRFGGPAAAASAGPGRTRRGDGGGTTPRRSPQGCRAGLSGSRIAGRSGSLTRSDEPCAARP
jgi:protein Tex